MIDVIRLCVRIVVQLDDLLDDRDEVLRVEQLVRLLFIELQTLVHLVAANLGKVVAVGALEHRGDKVLGGIGSGRVARALALVDLYI